MPKIQVSEETALCIPHKNTCRFIDDERGPLPSPKFPPPNVDPVPNWMPAKIPDSKTLTGRLVRLEKLGTAKHGSDLFRALNGPDADPNLWQYVLPGPFNVSSINYKVCRVPKENSK